MPTNVYCNGVQLHNVLTRQWDQEVVYDQSGTDVLYSRFKFRFEGLLHAQIQSNDYGVAAPAWIAVAEGNLSANAVEATQYDLVRSRLSVNRQDLRISMHDQTGAETLVFCASPMKGDIEWWDVNNGPTPRVVSITQIAGSLCFRLVFEIEACVIACLKSGVCPAEFPLVLNNRWSVSEDMDRDFYITTRIRGHVRLSRVPDDYTDVKGLVIPLLPPEFRREKITFSIDANGLDCDWEVEDRQIFLSAIPPATSMECSFTEAAHDETHMRSSGRVAITVAAGAWRDWAVVALIKALNSRTRWMSYEQYVGQTGKQRAYFLDSFALTENLGERYSIEGTFSIRRQVDGLIETCRRIADTWGRPLYTDADLDKYYHPNYSTDPKNGIWPTGKGNMLAAGDSAMRKHVDVGRWLVCWLQSPCSADPHVLDRRPMDPKPPEGDWLKTAVVEVGSDWFENESPPQFLDEYFRDDKTGRVPFYTNCAMVNRYVSQAHRAQMPVARSSDLALYAQHSSTFISLVPEQWYRIIEFDFESVGDWPDVPKPVQDFVDDGGQLKHRLLGYEINPHAPTTGTCGSGTIYRVHGRLVYGLSRAPTENERLAVGTLPIMKYKPDDPQFATFTNFTPKDSFAVRIGPGGRAIA